MMLHLLSDENFNGDIVRALLLKHPDLDLVRVQDVSLSGQDDPAILEWAAENDRILLTHDRATIPDFAYNRVVNEQSMPGVFVFGNRLAVSRAIEEILMLDECSATEEWDGRVVYLPL